MHVIWGLTYTCLTSDSEFSFQKLSFWSEGVEESVRPKEILKVCNNYTNIKNKPATWVKAICRHKLGLSCYALIICAFCCNLH